ncbi:MAG: T9SS C-terminal target domain-containing protein [Rhodothermus sp.]|nr:T9SS C-terminal target domain-containing protein [Rhodothermus sp.]
MNRRIACLIVVWSLVHPSLWAQSFEVERSEPTSGSVSVPIDAQIRFVFNDAVSQQTDFNTAFLFEPRRAVRIRRVDLIPETPPRTDCPSVAAGQVCPNVVVYTVTHRPETDYTWLVFAVQHAKGQFMTTPYVLRYTTDDTIGTLRVAGTIAASPAKRASFIAAQARLLRMLLAQAQATGLGRPVFEVEAPVVQDERDFTVVFLLRGFTQTVAAWDVAAATVIAGASGTYQVEHVRPGTYWPIAVRYRSLAQLVIEALGYYDGNGDGEPDPVTLENADATDITLEMHAFTLATARERLDIARNAAQAQAADAYLIGLVAANSPRRSGKAYTWIYEFFSPDQRRRIQVRADPLGVTTSVLSGEGLDTILPIPEPFIDSDQALTILLDQGRQMLADSIQADPTFAQLFDPVTPVRNLIVQLMGGGYYTDQEPSPDSSYWYARLTVVTSTQTRTYEGMVNMVSGQPYVVTDTEPIPDLREATVRLLPPYPHPFRTSVSMPLLLARPAYVQVVVYDLLGREVARLMDGEFAVGHYEVHWAASPTLPSGMYVVRVVVSATDGRRQIAQRLVTLVR